MYHGAAMVGKRFSKILRSIDFTQVAVRAGADRRPAARSGRAPGRSIEVRIVQRTQECNEVPLTPAAHVQLARQRVNLIPATCAFTPTPRRHAATSAAATDPLVEVDDVWKGREGAVVHVRSGHAQVAQ